MAKKLILSLDITDKTQALKIMKEAGEYIAMVKLSHYVVSSFSNQDIKEIVKNTPIMLDLKFYDIPNTVLNAIESYTKALENVSYFTFNGSMDSKTLRKISEIKFSKGVSVLILSSEDVNSKEFIKKAKTNYECGIRNFICPVAYIGDLKNELGNDIILFTPGVRSALDKNDDHSETKNVQEVIELGSNYVIVGRPIIQSTDIATKIKEYL
ncbi:MAG: orotidine-5'-phosphate decarboxylase [Alphaproteobacteria bacterium]|jgi:orotidine-5'-phosphate decarboxylase|nr:orotidine-5'-phosphate decarboxylase [Alphaproteobacteria bacterium]